MRLLQEFKGICIALLLCGVASNANATEYPGVTSAFRSAELSFDVAGKIRSINVREGAAVSKDQDLIVLYNQVEMLEVKRKYLVFISKAELNAAINKEKALKGQLESAKLLFDRGAVSAEDLQRKELDYLAISASKEQLTTREKVEEVEYHLAKAALNYRTLKAPFTGVVTRIIKDLGESVEANQPILKLVDLSKGYVITNLDPQIAVALRENQKVTIHIQGLDVFQGEISFISPEIDPASGLLQIKVIYENKDHRVRPGIAAKIVFPDI